MNVGREQPGGEAIGVVNLDSVPSPKALEAVQKHPDILSVSVIKLPGQGRSATLAVSRYRSSGQWSVAVAVVSNETRVAPISRRIRYRDCSDGLTLSSTDH